MDFKPSSSNTHIEGSYDKIYNCLKTTDKAIRLLHCHHSRVRQVTVTWNLEEYDLKSHSYPRYTALSYSWGDKGLSKTICLNGYEDFKVLGSVFAILEAIKRNVEFSGGKPDTWWWIDSICINQNDKDERTSQVKLMGDVYRRSVMTIGWLGSGSGPLGRNEDARFVSRGEEAIKSMVALSDLEREQHLAIWKESTKKASKEETMDALANVRKEVNLMVVKELMERPWWKRVWTLQEFLMPGNFTFWCGKMYISRSEWRSAIHELYAGFDYRSEIGNLAWLPSWNRRRLDAWWFEGHELSLPALLAYGSESEATDPRDRIFSVRDLAHHGTSITPDYKKPACDVYTDFVATVIDKHKSLDIIAFTHIFNQKGFHSTSPKVGKLPSWVPDWTAAVPSFVIPVMVSQSGNESKIGNFRPIGNKKLFPDYVIYSASGSKEYEGRFDKERKILRCEGIKVDTIMRMKHRKSHKSKNQKSPASQKRASIILDNLAKTLVLEREDRYLSLSYEPGSFYDAIRAFCLAAEKHCESVPTHPTTIPEPFITWYRKNRDVLVDSNYTLSEILKCAEEKPTLAPKYSPAAWKQVTGKNKFFKRFEDTTRYMEKVFTVTKKEKFAMVSSAAEKGDLIYVLAGCSVPLTLREVEMSSDDEDRPVGPLFEVVGEAYVDGFMDGEAVELAEKGILKFEDIRLG